MKIKNRELLNSSDAFKKLKDIKLPVRVSFQTVKLMKTVNEHLQTIEEVLTNLRRTYGEKDSKGRVSVPLESPNYQKFIDEVNTLLDVEVDIQFEKIKLPDKIPATCDACHHNMDKTFEIEPAILFELDSFIEV